MKRTKQEHKPRYERQNEIILTAHDRLVHANKRTFTNAKMARWLGLSVSTKLKRMMDELVEEGLLVKNEELHRTYQRDGGWVKIYKHVYCLTEGALQQLRII